MRTFETTHWSVVLAAGAGSSAQAREALDQLCRSYWQPVFRFLRQAGHGPEDAEDLTQQFLAELLSRDAFAGLDWRRGRFRSFLLASLRNFLGHQRERTMALKRGGGRTVISLEGVRGNEIGLESGAGTADVFFDRQWGMAVIESARRRLEAEYVAAGRSGRFEDLSGYLPGGEPERSQGEIAERWGVGVGAVKTEVYRMRQRFGQFLRMEVARTVSDKGEIDSELRYLVELFSGGSG